MRPGLGIAACLMLAACGSGDKAAIAPTPEAKANAPIADLRPDLKEAATRYPTDAAEIGRLIADSADIDKHRAAFVAATTELLGSKRCSAADFRAQGGWMKSAMKHANEPVYFIFCGGAMEENRIYLNAETGKILS